jgi:MFS family permease
MAYEERNIWASLIVGIVGTIVYTIILFQAAGGAPVSEVDWVPIMLWMIGASIVGAIVVSILWGIVASIRHPDEVGTSDQRDRDIARMGNRVGESFLVIAGLGVIVLCAFEVDWFWIANTMYYGFAVSTIVGGIASVIAYRRGLV